MNRYIFISLLLIFTITGYAQRSEVRPNIVFILADDLGYGDLSGFGSQSIDTPNLDKLAQSGMILNRFYTGSAVCTPSRASMLTGKFPLRYDIRKHFSDSLEHLPESSTTLAEYLKNDGYYTAHIGKWHLGGLRLSDIARRQKQQAALPGPLQHGFDYYLTNTEGAPIRPKLIKSRKLYREGGKYLLENDKQIPEIKKHWEEIKVDKAIDIMDAAGEKPFFINLWFDAPHTPYEPAPEPHLSKYADLGITGDQLYFRSMVSHLDANVGRVIEALKERGLYENTLIIFTSDNGPAFQGSPGSFKGGKTDLHEGGIRVPAFVVWQNHITPASRSYQSVHMADFLPSICAAAGVEVAEEAIDGKNVLPLLTGKTDAIDRSILLWQMDLYKGFQNQGPKPKPYITTVATKENWKMTAIGNQPAELFNLAQDHRELYNLLGEYPEIEKELEGAIKRFLDAPREGWDGERGIYER